jgi:protein-tyrosine phosphatase
MARPTDLPRDIQTAQASGVTHLVSLLEPAEAASLGLAHEADACQSAGITFLNHPIRDMTLPDAAPFVLFAHHLDTRLKQDAHIALNCRASIGRSGMLACAILQHFGFDAHTAIAHTSKRRGTPIPDTPEQTTFIHQMFLSQHS